MGRKKLEIKRIENKSSRQVTFSKRRNGLIEKARQLSILCESSIAVLVVSASGKLYNASSGDSMSKIIDRYEIQHADEQPLDLAKKTRNYLPHKELLEIVQSVDSLISLEEQLEIALSVTRAKKTEQMIEYLKSQEVEVKLLKEENQVLVSEMGKKILETEDENMLLPELSPEKGSGNNIVETLSLLK